MDYFEYAKKQIGKIAAVSIKMGIAIRFGWFWFVDGKKPAIEGNYIDGGKCDINFDILGLWTICMLDCYDQI